MRILYDFHGFDYIFEVPDDAIFDVFKKHYPEVDDITWWLDQDDNFKQFQDEFYDYFEDKFRRQAYEQAGEEFMDPYTYYGVSRSDFS